MSAFFYPARSVVERLPMERSDQYSITNYDVDNLYPQRMEQIMLRSPLVKKCVNILSDFINGEGFTNNIEAPLNDRGETVNHILAQATMDLSTYGGFALILGLNGLGTVESIEPIPFQFVRFGLADAMGRHSDVKISNNWERNHSELPQGSSISPVSLPLYNPMLAQENALNGAMTQVLYYTGLQKDKYPLATFDSITNAAESDADLQQWELNSIANGFHGLTLFKYPGNWEGDEEKKKIYNKISEATGVGGNGILAIEVDEEFTGDILENVAANNTDALFTQTILHVRETITQNYGMPGSLLGINAGGAVFNEQTYRESFVIYNSVTKNKRNIVEGIFNSLGDFGALKPNTILEEDTAEVVEEVVEEEVVEEEAVVEEGQTEALIRSIG